MLAVDTPTLCKLLRCGRQTAVQIGDLAHARITMNSRVLWSVQRIREYLYDISCYEESTGEKVTLPLTNHANVAKLICLTDADAAVYFAPAEPDDPAEEPDNPETPSEPPEQPDSGESGDNIHHPWTTAYNARTAAEQT